MQMFVIFPINYADVSAISYMDKDITLTLLATDK